MSPDTALLVLTVGFLLIYIELNRPGLILPGATGVTLVLIAAARLIRQGSLPPAHLAAGLFGIAFLVLSTRTRRHLGLGLLATAALLFGFHRDASTGPRSLVAIPCALFLGIGTSFLTTIAARARQNKGLDLK